MASRWGLATAVIAALVIGACGGTGTGATTSAPGATASANADPNVLPKPELTKIRIGIGAPNEPVQFSPKLAEMLGLFQKYGLSSEIVSFEGDGKAVQAVEAGQLNTLSRGARAAHPHAPNQTPPAGHATNSPDPSR